MPNTHQPEYEKSNTKQESRARNVQVYRTLTGNLAIPEDSGYWCLCGEQSNHDSSEIIQMVNCGLIAKNQFFGIDCDTRKDKKGNFKAIISNNRKAHPDMPAENWFRGEWVSCIIEASKRKVFKPSFIHLDTTADADGRIADDLVSGTLLQCYGFHNIVIFANVIFDRNPNSGRDIDPDGLAKNIRNSVPREILAPYEAYEFPVYRSQASTSPMKTFVFHTAKGKK